MERCSLPSLPLLASTLPSTLLRTPPHTSTHTFSHLQPPLHPLHPLPHTSSHLLTPSHTSSHLFTPPHTSTHLLTPPHTSSHLHPLQSPSSHLHTPPHTSNPPPPFFHPHASTRTPPHARARLHLHGRHRRDAPPPRDRRVDHLGAHALPRLPRAPPRLARRDAGQGRSQGQVGPLGVASAVVLSPWLSPLMSPPWVCVTTPSLSRLVPLLALERRRAPLASTRTLPPRPDTTLTSRQALTCGGRRPVALDPRARHALRATLVAPPPHRLDMGTMGHQPHATRRGARRRRTWASGAASGSSRARRASACGSASRPSSARSRSRTTSRWFVMTCHVKDRVGWSLNHSDGTAARCTAARGSTSWPTTTSSRSSASSSRSTSPSRQQRHLASFSSSRVASLAYQEWPSSAPRERESHRRVC